MPHRKQSREELDMSDLLEVCDLLCSCLELHLSPLVFLVQVLQLCLGAVQARRRLVELLFANMDVRGQVVAVRWTEGDSMACCTVGVKRGNLSSSSCIWSVKASRECAMSIKR
jgi:hypothetical protein